MNVLHVQMQNYVIYISSNAYALLHGD